MTNYDECMMAESKIDYGIKWLKDQGIDIENLDLSLFPNRVIHYKLYDKSEYKPYLSDKLNAGEMLVKHNLSDIQIPIVSSGRRMLELSDLKNLEEDLYIIKCNHASGWNIFFRPSMSDSELKKIVDKINLYLVLNFAYISGYEWQYENIERGWLIHKSLGEHLVDYQFFYEDEKCMAVDLQVKSDKNHVLHIFYGGPDGNSLDYFMGSMPLYKTLPKKFLEVVNRAKVYADELAKNIKFARIDFLCPNFDKIYFEEYTFSPYSGVLTFESYV